MNGRSGMNGRGTSGIQPRHPSLDNLRRSQHRSRSHSQLPSEQNSHDEPPLRRHEEEQGPLDKLIGLVSALAALICVFGGLTILTVLYITIRPFSKPLYRRLVAQLGEGAFLDAMAILLPNTRVYLTGDSDIPSPVGTSVLVCNHLLDGDWWAVLMLGRCVGLRGSVKVFLRKELVEINKARSSDRQLITRNNSGSSNHQVAKTVTFSRACPQGSSRTHISPELSLAGKLLHLLLDFPLLSAENNKDYISDREELFQLLRSFAGNGGAPPAPVHLLLYPEGLSLHAGSDRKAILAKSNEFAKREGRPQLKYLLLPRTTGFNASLESLRASSPVVYDVTMAYRGYDGSVPPSMDLSLPTLWRLLRRQFPSEVHFRIKRYSMEEVLQDATWLDKQWAEKDRVLGHFIRHQSFPTDNRGFCRHQVFDTRRHSVESSILALARLLLVPCAVPLLILLSIPMFWIVLWCWLAFKAFKLLVPDDEDQPTGMSGDGAGGNSTTQTPGSAGVDSASGTPYMPATPFASPSVTNWRDMICNSDYEKNDSPVM